jgi:WD40 repeat protein
MPQPDEKQFDLFISYAEPDHGWAEGYLADGLRARGVRCLTQAGFRLGAFWTAEFERAVHQADRVVLVLSAAYLADLTQRFVENLAQHHALRDEAASVIPLLYEGVPLPGWADARVSLRATTDAERSEAVDRLALECRAGPPGAAPEPECPYPGMLPFSRVNADYFCGRQTLAERLLQELRHRQCLFLIGPSGSGKTSLVWAALVPQLEREGWAVSGMQPGAAPAALLAAQTAHVGGPRHLLVVDQFEQVFTQAPAAEAKQFQQALATWVATPDRRLIVTVRSDFYPNLIAAPIFPLFQANHRPVLPPGEEELREAILGPAAKVNVYVERALVERLLADAAAEPGVLPHLQETLQLLWKKRRRRFLPLEAYAELGRDGRTGLQVAMAVVADAAVDNLLNKDDESAARRLFLRLIQFGEGRADTRRRQPLAALRGSEPDEQFDRVRSHLEKSRLLVSDEVRLEKESIPVVDIAHEALITGWPRLQEWIKDYRTAEGTRRILEAKVAEWKRLGQTGGWLDAAGVAQVEQWLASPPTAELGGGHPELLALLQGSKKRLAEEAERWKALYERAVARLLASQAEMVPGTSGEALVQKVLLAVESLKRERTLAGERTLREGLALLPQAGIRIEHDSDVRVIAFSPDSTLVATGAEDDRIRIWSLLENRELACVTDAGWVRAMAFSPDSKALATSPIGTISPLVRIWNPRTGKEIKSFGPPRSSKLLHFLEGGRYLATESAIFDVESGSAVVSLEQKSYPRTVALSADGQYLAGACPTDYQHNHDLNVWRTSDGRLVAEMFEYAEPSALCFSPGGRYLATATHDVARIWRTDWISEAHEGPERVPVRGTKKRRQSKKKGRKTDEGPERVPVSDTAIPGRPLFREELGRIQHDPEERKWDWDRKVNSIAFSPDDRLLATGSSDQTARVWDVLERREIARLRHDASVQIVSFAFQGRRLITATAYTARIYDVSDQREFARFSLPGYVHAVAQSPDGRWLAAAGGNAVIVKPMTAHAEVARTTYASDQKFLPGGRSRDCVAFVPDGTRLAIATEQGGLRLWDFLGSDDATYLEFGSRLVMGVADKGRVLWTLNSLGELSQWDTMNGSRTGVGELEERRIVTAAFSQDAGYLATADEGGLIRVRRTLDAAPVSWIQYDTAVGAHLVGALALAADGNTVVTGSDDKTIRLWDAHYGVEVSRFDAEGWVEHVAISPREDRIVAVCGAVVRLWEIPAGRPLARMIHGNNVTSVTFNRDGTLVATASADAAARVWDAATGQQISVVPHPSEVTAVAFSHDGRYLGTTSRDQVARVWFTSHEDLIEEACKRLPRNLTLDEWRHFIGEEPYRRTCPSLPGPRSENVAPFTENERSP